MAGEVNSTPSVHSFDIKSRVTRKLQLPVEADGYVPRILPAAQPEKIVCLTQNRHQDQLDVYVCNPRSTECRLVLTDNVKPYIGETVYGNFRVVSDGFVYMSEKSGTAQLYHCSLNGGAPRALTSGQQPVVSFYGYDAKTGNTYYSAKDGGPLREAVFVSDARGKVKKLSQQVGVNSAVFSANCRYFFNQWSNLDTPPVYSLCDGGSGKTLKVLESNDALRDRLAAMTLGRREFFSFTTSEGVTLNGWMVKPAGFSASKQYPVVMFQYSGPGAQQVVDAWSAGNMGGCLFEQYLAQEGFLCVCVDGRGTGGRGAQFEKQTYQHLGLLEARDQVEAALWLGRQPYVDKKRIGIWGWSYGGYITLMSMSEGRPVFAAGVAVAPVTSYRYYDTVYTERFMRTPKENPEGYGDNPITRASKLSGRLLICQGTADDNVHYRNVAEYAEALVQADKDFYQIDFTNRNHSISGGNTRHFLFRQIAQWFKAM
jgi:dipeptidyl-peptidase-4